MKDSNDSEIERVRARANARMYVEYNRWNNIGPAKKGVSKEDADYLLCLGSYPDMDINSSMLCKIFAEAPATVSGRLSGLESRGFIEKKQGSGDKREKVITLTERGSKKYLDICMFLDGNSRENPLDIIPNGLL